MQAKPQIVEVGDRAALRLAVDVLSAGGLAALPTETVYGLCALAHSDAAVRRVFAAKGRPAHNPLIVHLESAAAADDIAALGKTGRALGRAFWPGPLTLVAPCRSGAPVAAAARGGGAHVAVRVPAAAFFRQVISAVGPLVAPSANRSGRVSATSAAAVAVELGGRVDLIVDGGPSDIGVESTVVDVSDRPKILRPGAICDVAIAAIVGPVASTGEAEPVRSPGMLASHYAPRARLRLDVAPQDVRVGEGWLAFGPIVDDAPAGPTVQLSRAGDLDEAARRLYAALRALDDAGVETIAVSPIPARGIGIAIRDRLERAAAPRPNDKTPGEAP